MVIFFFNFLCRRDRSRTCLVSCHFSFDVVHFMKCHRWVFILIWKRWSFSWVSHRVLNFFYWGRLFAFTASSTCRSLQIQCQGKGDEITNIYTHFFSVNILARISAWWSFPLFLVIVVVFLLFFDSILYCLLK